MSNAQICAQKLAMLEGDPFQLAVTSLLGKNFLNFQCIPDAPQGDGGIDGLLDDSIGYCCYGIEEVPSHSPKELKDKLVTKFKKDLMRILEFDPDVMSSFVHKENSTLEGILPAATKLQHVSLVCNSFGHNQAIGALKTFFKKAKKASKRRFVAADCSITLEGPFEITNRLVVPADFHAQLDQTLVSKLLASPHSSTATPATISVFEEKMQALQSKHSEAKTERLSEILMKRWLEHLDLMEKLNTAVPKEYIKVHKIVAQIREEASVAFFTAVAADAIDRVVTYEGVLSDRFKKEVPLSETDARSLAKQVIAALIGECGIDWRTGSDHGT